MNKVFAGTRSTSESPLCHTCNNALVVRGTRFGDDVIRCQAGLGRVRFHVTECSSYSDARVIPVYRLEETAWRMFDGRFVSPSEFMRLNKDDD